MAVLLYNFAVGCYFLSIRIWSFFGKKARLWVNGRRGIFQKLENEIGAKRLANQPLLWMHCASLGEFEQGRPVLEAVRKERPELYILLTFFSPSGFELRKNYPLADAVFYLPADTRRNVSLFLDIVKPDLVVFVKYEFWYHYLHQLRFRQIPTFLISATFRKYQPFFRWYGGLHRRMLGSFTRMLVQDSPSANLLHGIGFTNVKVCGDTRVDRVLSIAAEQRDFPKVEKFCGDAPVLVCGSTWEPDEKMLATLLDNPDFEEWKLVVAPHDISESRLTQVENIFSKSLTIRHSRFEGKNANSPERVLLIDNIGMLSGLYRYGKIAYVGGGFGAGIHNTLEPMAHGLPVIFGPKHQKFVEAQAAKEVGAGFAISEKVELLGVMKKLTTSRRLSTAQEKVVKLMKSSAGATEIVMEELRPHL